jgi:hypothetical protein
MKRLFEESEERYKEGGASLKSLNERVIVWVWIGSWQGRTLGLRIRKAQRYVDSSRTSEGVQSLLTTLVPYPDAAMFAWKLRAKDKNEITVRGNNAK